MRTLKRDQQGTPKACALTLKLWGLDLRSERAERALTNERVSYYL